MIVGRTVAGIYLVTKTKNNNKNNWQGRPRYIED